MAGYLANMLGDANNLGYFATSEALSSAYPVGAPGYFAVVGATNTLWIWDEDSEEWADSGEQATDAYVYIAYASDDSGSDFSTAFSPTLDYIAIKNTTNEIPTPQASDFTGLWKKYKGEKGDTGGSASVNAGTTTTGAPGTSASVTNVGTELNAILNFTIPEGEKGDTGDTGNGIDNIAKTGTSGLTDTYTITFTDETTTTFDVVNGEDGEDGVDAYLYIAYASDDSGTDFTTTFNSTLDYIAIKKTTVEIPSPQASDFAGLWKKYKGEKGDTGERGLNWINEEYSGATTYDVDDALFYNGSSYRCILESTGNLPTDTTYWALIAQKGTDGLGVGDMLAYVYDPKNVAGDAFDMDNMVEGTNNKLVSSAEKTAWNDKLDDIKGESIADLSDVDTIAGITDGKVLKWDTNKFVVADDDDTTYTASDFDIKDLTDSTNLKTAWNDKLDDITGESIADLSDVDSIAGITDGKVLKWSTDKFVVADDDDTTYTATDFDIKDLTDSTNLRTTWNGKVDKSLFDANTILYATTDDTPVALTIPEQTIVGRKTGGNIEALAIDSDLSSVSANDDTVPSAKATKTALDLKAPLASPTFTGTVETPAIKITTGAGLGKVLTSDADGDATWETPSSGGVSLWTAITGTRASNTTITVATDLTAIFKKGMIVRWQESGVDKVGMVSIPSTYSSPNTTITIIGDTCASIDTDTFKYSTILGAEQFIKNFAVAGNIGAAATDVANAYYATEPMRVLGADLQVGTAGTTNNTTIDINKGGTTMFTTKPTLATTVASSPTPFTADTTSALALGDRVSIDIDAIQPTNAIDLYVQLYLLPTRYLSLS